MEPGVQQRVLKRLAGVAAFAVLAEAGLFALSRQSPAFASVIHTAMWVVAAVFFVYGWRSIRWRETGDRRRANRRGDGG